MNRPAKLEKAPDSITATPRDERWRDPKPWERFGGYSWQAEPQLLVSQRTGQGWTVNMAHRRAQFAINDFLAVVVVFVVGLAAFVAYRR